MLDVAVYYLLHYLMWGLNKVAIDFALLPERKTYLNSLIGGYGLYCWLFL